MKQEFVTVRVDSEVLKAFNNEAERLEMSRSELLREFMIRVKDCYGVIAAKKLEKLSGMKKLETQAAEWVMNNMPDELTPEMRYVIGGIFHLLANDLMRIGVHEKATINEANVEDTIANLESLGEDEGKEK